MGARNMWDRMLVYFGIVEDDDNWEAEESRSRTTTATAPRGRARRSESVDEWDEPAGREPRSSRGAEPRRRSMTGPAGVGVVPPRSFNDAQRVADDFKNGVPVIVNLQQTDSELSKRLIDFASGLTYGLDGSMQRIADRVFLLTPASVEVSAEERAALVESGFFNQS